MRLPSPLRGGARRENAYALRCGGASPSERLPGGVLPPCVLWSIIYSALNRSTARRVGWLKEGAVGHADGERLVCDPLRQQGRIHERIHG
jgi:hypothetical protein